jgi:retron-type reverse transcriptase
MARALLVLIRRFFNWCLDQHTFGLDRSPCDRLKPNKLIGDVPKRNRRLSDAELFAFWRATERMKYPVGRVYRIERWLKAPVSMPDGALVSREKGTPQGAVVSPILAGCAHGSCAACRSQCDPASMFERSN